MGISVGRKHGAAVRQADGTGPSGLSSRRGLFPPPVLESSQWPVARSGDVARSRPALSRPSSGVARRAALARPGQAVPRHGQAHPRGPASACGLAGGRRGPGPALAPRVVEPAQGLAGPGAAGPDHRRQEAVAGSAAFGAGRGTRAPDALIGRRLLPSRSASGMRSTSAAAGAARSGPPGADRAGTRGLPRPVRGAGARSSASSSGREVAAGAGFTGPKAVSPWAVPRGAGSPRPGSGVARSDRPIPALPPSFLSPSRLPPSGEARSRTAVRPGGSRQPPDDEAASSGTASGGGARRRKIGTVER